MENETCARKVPLMRTLIAKKPGEAVFTEEYAKPEAAGDEVVAKVIRNGVCATDIAILSGESSFMHNGSTSYPVRFGHEFAAKVIEVGPEVRDIKVGDTVVSIGYVSCEKCEDCLQGDYNGCKFKRYTGTINTYPGSYAEYVMFPEKYLVKVPSEISYDIAALMEPASVGMRGVQKAHIVPGRSIVLVTGAGAIGIAAAAFAKHMGARKVLLTGRTPYKLEIAKQMGIDAVCNTREESLMDFVKRETDAQGVDSVIECSGKPSVLNECVEALSRNGALSIVGFYERPSVAFDIDGFVMKGCVLESVMDRATEEAIQAVQEGVDLSPLITRHIRFEDCGDYLMDHLHEESKSDIKVMVDFD